MIAFLSYPRLPLFEIVFLMLVYPVSPFFKCFLSIDDIQLQRPQDKKRRQQQQANSSKQTDL